MEMVPVLTVIAVGFVGFCLMLVAFFLVIQVGGWQQAMRPTAAGHWPLARRLMFAGAVLGAWFGLSYLVLSLIPGGIPWLR
jgi:hypothetical protein